MSDLSPFYISSREQREKALDAQAGAEVLAQFGYLPTAPAEATTGPVQVQTDVSKIETSKIPGQRLRTGPAPEPKGLRLEGVPIGGQQRDLEPSPEALHDETLRQVFAPVNEMIRYLANTDDPEGFQRRALETLQKDPASFEGFLQKTLLAVGMSQPVVNSLMKQTHDSLTAAGAPNWATTAGEFIVAALLPTKAGLIGGIVPARMAIGAKAVTTRAVPAGR